MSRRTRDPRIAGSIFSWRTYLGIFCMVAGAVTSCSLLLLWNAEIELGPRFQVAALQNMGNVLFVSALFTLAYGLWRRVTVQRPVERILSLTRSVTDGDFAARIELRQTVRANELDVIAADLNRMAEELGGVETLRTDFVSSVSHEMRTPLAQISNCATLLQDPTLPEAERAELARKTVTSARRLSDLVTNILRLNRLENQQIFPEPEEYDLAEQLRECALAFEDVWEEKGVAVEIEVPDELHVRADAELLGLVWNNLLSNAFKFTEAGGRVGVSLAADGGGAVVRVSDTGCGIAPGAVAHVFDKFYQADTSHTTEGNGLGLALVRRVCDIAGCEVSVVSKPGAGSTFVVRMPAGQSDRRRVGWEEASAR